MLNNNRDGYAKILEDAKKADEVLDELAKGKESAIPPAQNPPVAPEPPKLPTPPAAEPKKDVQAEPSADPDKDKIIDALQKSLAKKSSDFEALKGKLNAEIPRYTSEIKALKEEMETLRAQLAEALERKPEPGQKPAPSERDVKAAEKLGISVEEYIEYVKPEPLEKPKPVAAKPKPAEEPPAPQKVPTQQEPLHQDQPLNLSDESWAVVDSYIPDYANTVLEVGADGKVVLGTDGKPKFKQAYINFLGAADLKTGLTNGQLLDNAVRTDDPNRFIAIITDFKNSIARSGRPERPLAPNTGGKGNPGLKQKPTYSRADAEAHYKHFQNNYKNMSDDEVKKYQAAFAEYEQAELEGRLV